MLYILQSFIGVLLAPILQLLSCFTLNSIFGTAFNFTYLQFLAINLGSMSVLLVIILVVCVIATLVSRM